MNKELDCYKCEYRNTLACPFRMEGDFELSGCTQGKLDQSLIPEGASEYDIPEPPGRPEP